MAKSQEELKDQNDNLSTTNEDLYATVDTDCSVCLFEKSDTVLPCMHAFCSRCIKQWLQKEKECPICRFDMKKRSNVTNSEIESSFFELIDIDGKDDVFPELEKRIEVLINQAVAFILLQKEYKVQGEQSLTNPFFKVDLERLQMERDGSVRLSKKTDQKCVESNSALDLEALLGDQEFVSSKSMKLNKLKSSEQVEVKDLDLDDDPLDCDFYEIDPLEHLNKSGKF